MTSIRCLFRPALGNNSRSQCSIHVPTYSRSDTSLPGVLAVEAMQLDSEGGVVQLMTQSEPPVHCFLSVHDKSGAALWDLRAQVRISLLNILQLDDCAWTHAHTFSSGKPQTSIDWHVGWAVVGRPL